ncbi:pseudouridine synthase [Halobacteriovorax sp. GB3]|uniref:pseudouridine synthase n=1 Tax=Halobacteriovorax sp. GB3 TaxID=2719615 RepID=UPI0023626015|nr:pseudouridine synthase [Halobacteriovorax sp. GB3]MDD0852586.1 pseudouridine synthase [Halobacteriovorax sp. GB3]
MSKEIRLQKFIADCGITSRRKAEELIVQGRVQLNGMTVAQLGTKVNPDIDVVMVDGQVADLNSVKKVYVVMNKPRGYVTTVSDPEGRRTVVDLVREVSERIYPVGRLDYLSEGLLIMTNDGEMANMIMHPRYDITKVYEVKVFGAVGEALLKKLRSGAQLEDGFVKPKAVRIIKQLPTKTWLEFRLGEGKNREIRKICEFCGLTVDKLKRVAIGGLVVEGITPGGVRYITKTQLLKAVGLNPDGSKSKDAVEYVSSKKSVNLKKKGAQDCTSADDKAFTKFRKDTYFESIKKIEESKKLAHKKEVEEFYAAKEEAHKKRVQKKRFRQKKKEESSKGVHAQFVK